MPAYYGGVPRVIAPDNCKTAVKTQKYYEPVIHGAYWELAQHYAVAITPARVRKPQDKPAVEQGVGWLETWLVCAFGQDACRLGIRTRFYRMSRLINELTLATGSGNLAKALAKLAQADILILDDWGLNTITPPESRLLLEVFEDRFGIRSTIIAAELPLISPPLIRCCNDISKSRSQKTSRIFHSARFLYTSDGYKFPSASKRAA